MKIPFLSYQTYENTATINHISKKKTFIETRTDENERRG